MKSLRLFTVVGLSASLLFLLGAPAGAVPQ